MNTIPLNPASYLKEGWWRDRLPTDDLADLVVQRPNDIATVTYSADGQWTERLTYAELAEAVDSIAAGLLDLDVAAGEPVAYQVPNWWYFTAMHLACARIGAISCPVIPILRRRELTYMLSALRARVFVVPTTYRRYDHAALGASLLSSIDSLEYVFDIDGPRDGNGTFQKHFLGRTGSALPRDLFEKRRPSPDDVASIQFTSGTTGEPKGVLHTHNTLFATTRLLPWALELTSEDVVIMPSPLAHASGFLYGVLMPITWGQKVVYQDIWDARRFLDIVKTEEGTYTIGSPPFIMDTIKACRELSCDAAPLRIFSCAGAPIPRYLATEVPKVLGARLANNWGLTETGGATITPASDLDRARDSDGLVSPAMEIKIVDAHGDEVPHGESGRLLIRGASRFVGYFERPDLTDSVIDTDGWLDSGDLASMDADGYVSLTGRAKDIVIRGGENIPVVEIEAALYEHPDVDEVAVIGLPDPRLGERACAVVVPVDGSAPTLPSLVEYLENMGFAKQFWPERIEVVSSLPRTPAGKVQKFLLQRKFSEG